MRALGLGQRARGAWLIFAVVAVTYPAGIIQQTFVNEADDYPAYFNFCEKLLETGSFGDPFSWRRLASLGGHTLLQCSVLAQASPGLMMRASGSAKSPRLGRTPIAFISAALS